MKSEPGRKMTSSKNKTILATDILIVDGEAPNQQLLTQLLSEAGYQVRLAERSQLAIESTLAQPPSLILLDVKMPEIDGFEVCKRFKQNEHTRDIPIIFITALHDIQDKVRGFEAGCVDFITKPFQEEEVLARVQTHMELRNMQLNLEKIISTRTSKLMESESRFRATFEQAAVGIVHVSTDGKFLRVNKKFCDIVGYSEDEMLRLTFQDITHPDDLDADLEYVRQVLDGEIETYSIEKRYFQKDGSIVWVNLTVSLLFDRKGKPKYFVSVIKDISNRKEAEEALRLSNEFQQHLINTVPDAVFTIRMPERLIEWSNDSYNILGYESEECIGETTEKFYASLEEHREVGTLLENAIKDEEIIVRTETLLRRKNGEIFPAEINAAFFREKGTVTTITALVRDISERKQAEEALRKQHDFFEHLTSAVPDAIYSIKVPERTINWANDSFNVMGYEDKEYIGQPVEKYYASHEEYTRVGALQREAISKGENMIRTEIRVTRKDGRVIPAELTATFFVKEGKKSLITAMIRDISERKQAENKLIQSNEEIKELQKRLQAESDYLQEEIKLEHNFENIIGQSDTLAYVLQRIEQVASLDSIVLIQGETGTGKELVARAIHKLSPRGKRPLVKVNCAALPSELIESELFGREKGAYTGAATTQIGRFELASESTLFLDEIGELPPALQAKLLRVIESGEFERLGSARTMKSNARIVAATNRDLEEEVRNERFREDLMYRLRIFPVTIPPLRERKEDIPLLVKSFVQSLAKRMGKSPDLKISKRCMEGLQSYHWPGNVRELKHVIEGSIIAVKGNKLHFDLPKSDGFTKGDFQSLEEMERQYILQVLDAKNWKIAGVNSASSVLGMHANTLRSRMQKLGIQRP